ncbi:ataxin-7-like [Aricia agestis]|uniref:ataxin-7-like n=1 Tax=Aricia agestis TaxID=91739 RepID=UPI001C209986|nr:ataxin-7-like [Aricia agestis]
MSGDFPFVAKLVSPLKCNEKPWDLWVSEIGHLSPRRDDEAGVFAPQAATDVKANVSRRVHAGHPYKAGDRGHTRYRRAGVNRLRADTMSLHSLFPQMDNLNAAVCHMCGVIVKCSAAYRHLLESHGGAEPILPPPPPTVKLKSVPGRSRHKKDPPPPVPVDILPVKLESSPVHTAAAPISRIVLPQPDLQYLEEPSTSSAISGEVQVSMASGELPVVSIQDTEELPLGENLTDDIFAIMNSEGIQSADDITNTADWKNIIRDIGNMHDMNFSAALQSQDLYSITENDLNSIQFPNTSPMLTAVVDNNIVNTQVIKAIPATTTPVPKPASRRQSKTKFNLREYDPNKHCGVVTIENPRPCTRSLTCKAHALSLRRMVEGRSKPFDTLLAEHRASRDAAAAGSSAAPGPVPHPTPAPGPLIPPLLVNTPLDLGTFNGLTDEQQVNDIYASLLSVEDPVLPDTSSITSLLSQPLPAELLLPDEAELPEVPVLSIASPPRPAREDRPELPPALVPADVCWYSSCPRPLALCTFNASHAGGAVTLGKRFATVRSSIKSALSRGTKTAVNSYAHSLSLSKTMHMNSASKTNKPEVRKLIVTCSASGGKEVQQTLSELFGCGAGDGAGLNGHVARRARGKRPPSVLDLAFPLDPLLADEKC